MKKKKLSVLCLVALFISSNKFFGQSTTMSNTGFGPEYLGWSNNTINLKFQTNGFNRMIIDNGAGVGAPGLTGGQIAIGNNLPANFQPQGRLHIHQDYFGNRPNTPFVRFTTTATGTTNIDGFTIGNSTQPLAPNLGDVHLNQFETAPIIASLPNANPSSPNLLPYEWFRIQNNQTFLASLVSPIRVTDGYIGLNKSAPRAHIDMITPAFQGGEEFFFATPDDIPIPAQAANVQMGMMNLTANNGQLAPGFFGNLNQQFQWGSAMATIGCIHNAQDISSNVPVSKFVSATNWIINANQAGPTNTVTNRPIFAWYNGSTNEMYMDSRGRVRIGDNLNMNNSGPAFRPNNRIEITAWTNDPYFNVVGNPGGNPNWGAQFGSASGLRFTFLTSNDLVQVPSATNGIDPAKVLTIDKNGDVVAINTMAGANNGLSVLSASTGIIQLGALCGASPSITALAALQNNRQIPLNGKNLLFTEAIGGAGKVGIGAITTCLPGNLLEVKKGGPASPTSGLRLTDLVGATPTGTTGNVLSINPVTGDVILVPDIVGTGGGGGGTANNGLQVTGGTTQLGVFCGGSLASTTFTTSRAIDQNNFSFEWRNGRSGFGNTTPCAVGNRVEIGGLAANQTGLRFSNVTSATTPAAYAVANGKVLSVDNNGDVTLVPDRTAAQNGLNTTASPGGEVELGGTLIRPTPINMGTGGTDYNVSFVPSTPGSPQGNVAIGAAHNSAPTRLQVNNSMTGLGTVYGEEITVQQPNATNEGLKVSVQNTSGDAYGLEINASAPTTSVAIYEGNGDNFFHATSGNTGFGIAPSSFSKVRIATTASANTYALMVQTGAIGSIYSAANNGHVGIGTTPDPGYFLTVNGQALIGGTAVGSDQSLKTNIDTINNATSIIKQLKPKQFYYDTTNIYGLKFSNKKQYGLIAQDVETLLPELVNMASKGADYDTLGNIIHPAKAYKTVNYNALFGILIKGMQEQQRHIEKQDSLISALTSSVSSCCSSSAIRTTRPEELNQLNIDLSDKDAIVLNQNVPNPFAEQTTITYNIPEKYNVVQILFYNNLGQIIKVADIKTKGKGQLNVFASDLSRGMYSYSLYADGKIVDTKKMVKED